MWVDATPAVSTFDRHKPFLAVSVSVTEDRSSSLLIGSTCLPFFINLPQLHSVSVQVLYSKAVITIPPWGKQCLYMYGVCFKTLQQSLMCHLMKAGFHFPEQCLLGHNETIANWSFAFYRPESELFHWSNHQSEKDRYFIVLFCIRTKGSPIPSDKKAVIIESKSLDPWLKVFIAGRSVCLSVSLSVFQFSRQLLIRSTSNSASVFLRTQGCAVIWMSGSPESFKHRSSTCYLTWRKRWY